MKNNRPKKYAIVINALKCMDCKACMIACKVENEVPKGLWRNWVKHTGGLNGKRTQYQPGQCMQCDAPSCVAACPVAATYKQKNGIVAIDPEKCIGCGNCVTACPYGARYREPVQHIADKCDFCRHRLERGEEPACVETCPTKARIFGDLRDPSSKVSQILKRERLVRVINPLINTQPSIYYIKGTSLLDWPKAPTLPGGVHMSPDFWKS